MRPRRRPGFCNLAYCDIVRSVRIEAASRDTQLPQFVGESDNIDVPLEFGLVDGLARAIASNLNVP